jgi:hypothetical protein
MAESRITVSHINVRQSITLLLAKLVTLDIILAVIIIGLYTVMVAAESFQQTYSHNTLLFLITFTVIGIIKISLSTYVVLQWFNEYYQINSDSIIHRRGIVSKRSERYDLGKVRAVTINRSALGEVWDFATVTLYDIRLHKYLDLYLIHNPVRFAKIIVSLKPKLEITTHEYELPLIKNKEKLIEAEE